MEFLVTQHSTLAREPEDKVAEVKQAERAYADSLRASGHLARIWRIPGTRDSIVLYEADDATKLHEILTGLPSFPWMTFEIQPLAVHPQEAR